MRRTPRSPLEIKATEWNRIQDASSTTGRVETSRPIEPSFTRAIGKNLSGEVLTAGSPVYYGPLTTDGTVSVYTTNPLGFHDLHHSFWPQDSTELALYASQANSFSRVGVVLEDIPVGEPGRFAIAGVVAVKGSAGVHRYARPAKKSTTYKTTLTGDRWGYRILGTFADWMLIDLDSYYTCNLVAKTKVGGLATGAMGLVTIYDPSSTGWAISVDDYPAWTLASSITADNWVTLLPTQDRWLALKVC
jgi:hypothetical protein